MSATTSAATGRCFGIQRVCQVWERSRSALYARRARAHHHRLGAGPARRGPPPRQSDAQLLAAIRTDLARSPFHGEGHRKVHARLRILDGIRVARTRVLREEREGPLFKDEGFALGFTVYAVLEKRVQNTVSQAASPVKAIGSCPRVPRIGARHSRALHRGSSTGPI